MLERRSHRGFGRYISYHEFADQDPGLLIWRRHRLTERPLLVTADGRRIRDAREKEKAPTVPEYQDQLSDPFPVPAGLHKGTYPGQPAVASVYAHTDTIGLRQYTRSLFSNPDPGNLGVALTDIRRDAEAGALTLGRVAQLLGGVHCQDPPDRRADAGGLGGRHHGSRRIERIGTTQPIPRIPTNPKTRLLFVYTLTRPRRGLNGYIP